MRLFQKLNNVTHNRGVGWFGNGVYFLTPPKIKSWDELPEVFGVRELAGFLGIALANAYELTRRDGFPRINVGERSIRISKEGLRVWLREQYQNKK